MNKKEVLESIIKEQQSVIENLQESVDRYKTASDLEENSASDPDELSHQTEAKDMQLRFEQLHSEAKNNLNLLESEKENSYEEIENGSLIETENFFFFVGISVPSFDLNGKQVISVSEEAPIFKEMQGKKAGDEFKMGDTDYKILDIK
ncbi:hypothetical protein [Halpernia frigidisoli]|uniref:Transcription elongation factor n=1 Tax=Halpernia frigidisoli TaxID=1125876 RepID=A0A1I3HSH8_9FLAO|nr:hypothetical protein [Halpernia frigidisoli]SFI38611.1 hypothetical protein SAMN05443292_2368 [Halpernia frigidisoli]